MVFGKTSIHFIILQVTGFQGRPNKIMDSCYSYWIGNTLSILGGQNFIDTNFLLYFIKKTHCNGGFSKHSNVNLKGEDASDSSIELNQTTDPYHSSFSINGLSLCNFAGIHKYNYCIGIRNDRIPECSSTSIYFDELIKFI